MGRTLPCLIGGVNTWKESEAILPVRTEQYAKRRRSYVKTPKRIWTGFKVLDTPKNEYPMRSDAEMHDGDPKPNASFGQLIADEEFLALEHLFDLVQGLEQWANGGLVCFGAVHETGFVNTIWTDNRLTPWKRERSESDQLLIVLYTQSLTESIAPWGKCRSWPAGENEIVKLGIEHSDDLGTFVIHDCLVLLVPKHGDGEPAGHVM